MLVYILVLTSVLALACGLCPDSAYATYKDVANGYPAQQDIVVVGEVFHGSDIPNGTYLVPARTSSAMCVMYDPSEKPNDDDSDRKSELAGKCLLTVDGDDMYATFYISKSYTALYMGSAEDAAAQTNDDATDGSAYLFGDPVDGYVYRLFTIPVSSINEVFTMSTYTGASEGREMWYTRQVLISTSDELNDAIFDSRREGGEGTSEETVVVGGDGGGEKSSAIDEGVAEAHEAHGEIHFGELIAAASASQKAAEEARAKAEEAAKIAQEALKAQKRAEQSAAKARKTAANRLKANTMKVTAKTVKAKAKKKTTVKKAKAFTVKNAKGKVTFFKTSGNAKITISKSGKVTVKKGLKKGKTYRVKVLVCAAGNKQFAPAFKTVTLKVKVTK